MEGEGGARPGLEVVWLFGLPCSCLAWFGLFWSGLTGVRGLVWLVVCAAGIWGCGNGGSAPGPAALGPNSPVLGDQAPRGQHPEVAPRLLGRAALHHHGCGREGGTGRGGAGRGVECAMCRALQGGAAGGAGGEGARLRRGPSPPRQGSRPMAANAAARGNARRPDGTAPAGPAPPAGSRNRRAGAPTLGQTLG
jgi:hypothetical protein